jgi:hypothetical protein
MNKLRILTQARDAKRRADKLLDHIPKCQRCSTTFQKFNQCPYIKALPNGKIKEANEHIMNSECCSRVMQEILSCPNLPEGIRK